MVRGGGADTTAMKQEGNTGVMNEGQLSELIQNSRDTNHKVSQMHTTIFGAEGQGGLLREHREFKESTMEELALLQKHREEMSTFKQKLVLLVTLAASVASFFGSKIAALLTKTP
jgi:hypothetical protein